MFNKFDWSVKFINHLTDSRGRALVYSISLAESNLGKVDGLNVTLKLCRRGKYSCAWKSSTHIVIAVLVASWIWRRDWWWNGPIFVSVGTTCQRHARWRTWGSSPESKTFPDLHPSGVHGIWPYRMADGQTQHWRLTWVLIEISSVKISKTHGELITYSVVEEYSGNKVVWPF